MTGKISINVGTPDSLTLAMYPLKLELKLNNAERTLMARHCCSRVDSDR
ncbi:MULTISPECIES: hypothetical protein [unclassified Microcoleus]